MNKNLCIPPPTYILIGYNLINKKTIVTFLTVVCSTQLQRARYISKAPASRQCRAFHIKCTRSLCTSSRFPLAVSQRMSCTWLFPLKITQISWFSTANTPDDVLSLYRTAAKPLACVIRYTVVVASVGVLCVCVRK